MEADRPETVVRALQRLANQDPSILPRDPRHIQAYQAARQTVRRVNAAALKQFLMTQQTQVEQAAKVLTTFWLVPKSKLPEPGPDIERAIVSPEQLASMPSPTGSLDFSEYLVVDQLVPRNVLPLGTTEVRFALGAVTSYLAPEAEPVAHTEWDKESESGSAPSAATPAASAATGAASAATGVADTLKRSLARIDSEPPAGKRRRAASGRRSA